MIPGGGRVFDRCREASAEATAHAGWQVHMVGIIRFPPVSRPARGSQSMVAGRHGERDHRRDRPAENPPRGAVRGQPARRAAPRGAPRPARRGVARGRGGRDARPPGGAAAPRRRLPAPPAGRVVRPRPRRRAGAGRASPIRTRSPGSTRCTSSPSRTRSRSPRPASNARANGSVYSSTRSPPTVAAHFTASGTGSMNRLTRTPIFLMAATIDVSVSTAVSAGHPAWLVTSPGFTGTSVHCVGRTLSTRSRRSGRGSPSMLYSTSGDPFSSSAMPYTSDVLM